MGYKELNPTTMLSPLPCVLVTCGEPGKGTNAMTVAWTGIVNTHPPMLSISVKPERYSHDLILKSREFCVHPADREHIRAVDFCGVKSGKSVDKISLMGLQLEDSGLESAPAVSGFPICIPCVLRDVYPLGSHDLFLGEGLLHIVTDSIRNSEPYSVSLAFPLHARKRMREECETSRMLILFAGNAVHHDI